MTNQARKVEFGENRLLKGKLAFVVENALTKEECDEFISLSEERGYEMALVNVGGGRQTKMPGIRNNYRCIWDSPEQADRIWERVKQFIPEYWEGHKVIGLNERLRILRYDPGEYFAPHFDGYYVRENGESSYITIQLYLNEGFEGGCTTFLDRWRGEDAADLPVVPKTGSVLVFQHNILHEGSELKKGRKYTIRTDVMYTKETYRAPSDQQPS